MKVVSAFLLLTFWNLGDTADENPVVALNQGSIKGTFLQSRKGQQFYAFRGIRYAKAPVGALRFMPPVPVDKWTGVLDATKDGPVCLQPSPGKHVASEDCLLLNVYTRNLQNSAPVIVHIHGGAMVGGSANSEDGVGPQYLMDQAIVFVAIQYRLGPIGFMSTGNGDAAGNYGFKDQREALRWVRDNINKFGGDPNSVTLMGQSAGSMGVNVQVISPSSRSLIHRAILMSGSAVSHFETDNVRWTYSIAKDVGCPTDSTSNLINCLRATSGSKIIDATKRLEYTDLPVLYWNYQVEDPNSKDPLLTKEPLQYMIEGDFARIPILTGITKDEFHSMAWSLYNAAYIRSGIDDYFSYIMPIALMYSRNPKSEDISKALRKFYLNNEKLTSETLPGLEKLIADSMISHGVHLFAKLARKFTNVFYYQNNYIGKWSLTMSNGKPNGVGHTDDLHYIFSGFGPWISTGDSDNVMVERMTGWWTQFAKTGSPNNPANSWTNEIQWPASNAKTLITLNFDKTCYLSDEPYQERFAVWDRAFGYDKL